MSRLSRKRVILITFVSFSIISLVESWSTNTLSQRLMSMMSTNLMCSKWMWPNESFLETLDNELGTIQNDLSTTRRIILESYHNAPQERSLIEERLTERRDRDAAIVSACTKLLPEIDGNTIDMIKSKSAFIELDCISPIPKGILRPNREHSLSKYLSAQIKRHLPAPVRDIETRAVRDDCDAALDTTNESWQEAQQNAQQSITQVIEQHTENLIWSDHKPIRATLGDTISLAAWNILERRPNGIHPVLPILTFVSEGSKEERRNSVTQLEHAMLHPPTVSAHAHAVVQWTLEALKTHDAVCLSEVGGPVVNALQKNTDLVVSISKHTENQSLNPSPAGTACEGRTAVVARNGQIFPDIPVMVGTKVRYLACLRLNGVFIVSVHVPRGGVNSRCPKAGGGVFAAREALQQTFSSEESVVLAVGDWNGNVELIGGIRVGKPTTFADVVRYPESQGIDGALLLSSKDNLLKVEHYS